MSVMTSRTTQWGARLIYHVRDEHGRPAYDDATGAPLTVTVTPWWGTRSRIPDGPRVSITANLPQPAPSSEALDRAIDHVHDWSGVVNGGVPIACSRNVLKAMCLTQPRYYAELLWAIRLASTSGVL